MASILKECEGVTIHISAMLVLVCWIECTPCNFGFVTWLDGPLLQYLIASIVKECDMSQGCSQGYKPKTDPKTDPKDIYFKTEEV